MLLFFSWEFISGVRTALLQEVKKRKYCGGFGEVRGHHLSICKPTWKCQRRLEENVLLIPCQRTPFMWCNFILYKIPFFRPVFFCCRWTEGGTEWGSQFQQGQKTAHSSPIKLEKLFVVFFLFFFFFFFIFQISWVLWLNTKALEAGHALSY